MGSANSELQMSGAASKANSGRKQNRSGGRGRKGSSSRTGGKGDDLNASHTVGDFSLLASDGGESNNSSDNSSMASDYNVGEIDENGFVCIGIGERKVK